MTQQSGLAATGVDLALDPDDGGDMGLPVGVGEFVCWIEDGDSAALVAAAPDVVAAIDPERRRGGGDFRYPRVQGWLIVRKRPVSAACLLGSGRGTLPRLVRA